MNDRTKRMIRYFLVIPAAVGGFLLAFLISILLHAAISSACPGLDSGASGCPAWYVNIPPLFGAGFAPILVIAFGGLTTPAKRAAVTWTLYAIGLGTAIWMGHRQPQLPMIAAITGAITAAIIARSESKGAGA